MTPGGRSSQRATDPGVGKGGGGCNPGRCAPVFEGIQSRVSAAEGTGSGSVCLYLVVASSRATSVYYCVSSGSLVPSEHPAADRGLGPWPRLMLT